MCTGRLNCKTGKCPGTRGRASRPKSREVPGLRDVSAVQAREGGGWLSTVLSRKAVEKDSGQAKALGCSSSRHGSSGRGVRMCCIFLEDSSGRVGDEL